MENEMTLVQIMDAVHAIRKRIMENGGEITPEDEKAMVTVDEKLPAKIDGYQAVITMWEAEAEAFESQAKMYEAARKTTLNLVKGLKTRLCEVMKANEIEEIEGTNVVVKRVKNAEALEVFDEAKIHGAYFTIVQTQVRDNARIKADLQAGFPVEGAKLTRGEHVRFSVRKGKKK